MQHDNHNGTVKLTGEIDAIKTLRGLRSWATASTTRLAQLTRDDQRTIRQRYQQKFVALREPRSKPRPRTILPAPKQRLGV